MGFPLFKGVARANFLPPPHISCFLTPFAPPSLSLYFWVQASYTLFFFYKKPRVRGSGSAFLRIPEFESQKFLRSIKILKILHQKHFMDNNTCFLVKKSCHFASNVDEIGIQLSNFPYFSLIFS